MPRWTSFSKVTVSHSFENVHLSELSQAWDTLGTFLLVSEINVSISPKDCAVQNVLCGPAEAVLDFPLMHGMEVCIFDFLPLFGGAENGTGDLIQAKEAASHSANCLPSICV